MKRAAHHPRFIRRDKVREIFRNDSLIVVYKPPGILSQGDRTGDTDLLTITRGILAPQSTPRPFLGLVHRLDRPAAGLVVFARSSSAAAFLSEQFRRHMIDKKYLAVVHGHPEHSGSFRDLLIKDSETVTSRTAEPDESGARESILHYQIQDVIRDRSLVTIHLETGRSHQIRVQFSSRGFPIVGDRKYGSREVLRDPGMIALWAHHLAFRDPESNRILTFESPRPLHWPWHEQTQRTRRA